MKQENLKSVSVYRCDHDHTGGGQRGAEGGWKTGRGRGELKKPWEAASDTCLVVVMRAGESTPVENISTGGHLHSFSPAVGNGQEYVWTSWLDLTPCLCELWWFVSTVLTFCGRRLCPWGQVLALLTPPHHPGTTTSIHSGTTALKKRKKKIWRYHVTTSSCHGHTSFILSPGSEAHSGEHCILTLPRLRSLRKTLTNFI